MQKEVIVAGFGGQGVLFAGQVLTYAALHQGLEVTWIPSYGPEMRGGTANCTVVIADEEIGSPLVKKPTAVIALNLPSLNKYEKLVQPGGVLIVNQSMVDRIPERSDVTLVLIPANDIADELGSSKMLNMVVVGALLAHFPVVTLDSVEKALSEHLPAKHQHLLSLNGEALRRGYDFASQHAAVPA
ncbi:MAG: 2-oxoacid:acceptor oxidoreductase family protein [Anaerolineales bacterium]|nr:2-oxoacid:acceptor oxidoreductase family protein [Anaerolineales bacterium]